MIHEAFYVARSGRPGPVVVDLPKDVQFAAGRYAPTEDRGHRTYRPRTRGDRAAIEAAVDMIAEARQPVFYTGGGVINSGVRACELLTELVRATGYPVTNTVMGLGGYPASDPQFLGMLGMHGTYEANLAMAHCDVMVAVGARFDDRITGRLDAFSQGSRKIHIDIDPSSINKNVPVDIGIVGDVESVLGDMLALWKKKEAQPDRAALARWVAAHRRMARPRLSGLRRGRRHHQAAIRDRAALSPRQGARRLHHHRGRPAPDVGRRSS